MTGGNMNEVKASWTNCEVLDARKMHRTWTTGIVSLGKAAAEKIHGGRMCG